MHFVTSLASVDSCRSSGAPSAEWFLLFTIVTNLQLCTVAPVVPVVIVFQQLLGSSERMAFSLTRFFRSFTWFDNQTNFEPQYELERFRRNYHVVMLEGKWTVHGEGAFDVAPFDAREDAIDYANAMADSECTEAVVHTADGNIETRWGESVL